MSNENWLTLEDVLKLVDIKPNQNVLCVSNDGSKDFVMTVQGVAETLGCFYWADIKFRLVEEETNNTQKIEINTNKPYKVRTFESNDLLYLENRINEFIGNIDSINIINVMYQAFNGSTGDTFTAMVFYMEV